MTSGLAIDSPVLVLQSNVITFCEKHWVDKNKRIEPSSREGAIFEQIFFISSDNDVK